MTHYIHYNDIFLSLFCFNYIVAERQLNRCHQYIREGLFFDRTNWANMSRIPENAPKKKKKTELDWMIKNM